MIEPEVHRSIECRHADRHFRGDAGAYGLAYVVVDVALMGEILDVLVVGAETYVIQAEAERCDVGEHGGTVVVHTARHHCDRCAEPQSVEDFSSVEGIVIIADTTGKIGPQRLVGQPGRMTGDALAGGERLELLLRGVEREVEWIPLTE